MVCSSLPLGFLLNLKNKTSIWFVVVVVVCVFVLELFYRLITFRPRKKAKVCAKDDKKQTVLILLVYLTPVWYVCGKKEGLFFSSCDSSSMRRTYAARTHTHTHTHLPTRGYLLFYVPALCYAWLLLLTIVSQGSLLCSVYLIVLDVIFCFCRLLQMLER